VSGWSMRPWESVPAPDNGNGVIAAGRSVLGDGGGAWACAIAGMAGSAVSRMGARMAGIVVRNLSDWCPIGVRFCGETD
jgi:hypothetical protein